MKKDGARIGVALLVVGGVVLWNTWVFGWLNHGVAGYTQMSISELNVAGQPYASFFSVTEGLSGLFLLVGALSLAAAAKRGGFLLTALALIGLIGALTVFDATHSVDCNQYQNPVCVMKTKEGQISSTNKEHNAESTFTNYITVLLALLLVGWIFARKSAGEDVALAELLLVVLLAVAIIASWIVHTDSVVLNSVAQRFFNTLTSFAFLYVAYRARPFKQVAKRA